MNNFIYLKKDKDEIEFLIQTEKIKSEKQIRILNFLIDNEGITPSDLALFTDTSIGVIKTLENKGYIEKQEENLKVSQWNMEIFSCAASCA